MLWGMGYGIWIWVRAVGCEKIDGRDGEIQDRDRGTV